jgi:outer membrane protein assembly factor BamB
MNDSPFNKDKFSKDLSKRFLNRKIEEMFQDDPKELKHRKKSFIKNLFYLLREKKGLLIFMILIAIGWLVFFYSHYQTRSFENVQIEKYWQWKAMAPIVATPIISDVNNDGFWDVVFADSLGYAQAFDPHNKKMIYSIQLGNPVISSLVEVEVDNKDPKEILVVTRRGSFFTLNNKGNYLYKSRSEFFNESIFSQPLVLFDKKIFLLAGMKGSLWSVDSDYGEVLWVNNNSPIKEEAIFSSPVWAGTSDKQSMIIVASEQGRIAAFNVKGGGLFWEKKFAQGFKSSLLLTEKGIFASGLDGTLWLLSLQGEVIAKNQVPETFISSPVLINFSQKNNIVTKKIIVASESGKVFLITFDSKIKTINKTLIAEMVYQQDGDSFIASPTIFDLNSDGFDDVLLITRQGHLILLNGQNWKFLTPIYPLGFQVTATPVLADLNGDGNVEVVIGGENGQLIILTLKTFPYPMFKKNILLHSQFRNQAQ